MHLKRWLTAIVALPLLIYIIGPGPEWLFQLLVFCVAVLGLTEFHAFSAPKPPGFILVANAATTLLLFLSIALGRVFLMPAVISLWVLLPLSYLMLTYGARKGQGGEVPGWAVAAPFYVCLPLSLLLVIDRLPAGGLWIFFMLSVVFMGDTGAFYAGRLFGRHKLYPSVSPGKTWEGALGGFICSLGASLLFIYFFPLLRPGPRVLAVAGCLSLAGQIGDLVESMVKRSHGVKDSGRILPGHGGILDRIDSLLFSIPVFFIFLYGWVY